MKWKTHQRLSLSCCNQLCRRFTVVIDIIHCACATYDVYRTGNRLSHLIKRKSKIVLREDALIIKLSPSFYFFHISDTSCVPFIAEVRFLKVMAIIE